MDDHQLLQQYVENQSEAAFTELVQRHVNLVFGTALRVVQDAALAQDVSQAVFIKLARKAWTVRDGNALPAWLYRAAYHEACNTVRGESRRRHNETEAMKFADEETPSASAWEQLGPLVDEALQRLSRVEQNAVILRFFEGKSLEETGAVLGTTEAAARMRVNRAVEKIRRHFARGGVTIASGALVAAMTTHACRAAPAGFTAGLAQTSLANAAGAGGVAHAFWRIFSTTTQSKVALTACIVAAAAAIPLALQRREIGQLEAARTPAVARANTSAPAMRAGAAPATLSQYEAELKRILSLQGGMDLTRSLLDFAGGLDAATARALLDDLAKLPPTDKNKLALDALVDRLVRLDAQGALDWANSITNTHGREEILGILFDTWSNSDPAAALAAAQTIDQASLRETLIGEVIENMIRSNPQAALAVLRTLPGNKIAQSIYDQFFNAWGGQNPAAAAAAVLNLPATRDRNLAILGVVNGWASVDPAAALSWAGNLPAGDARTQAVTAALKVLAQQDPPAATAYVANVTNTVTRNQYVQEVASQWGQDDPVAAMAWVQQNLSGKTLESMEVELAGPLTQVDPPAAANYLAQMPRGGGLRMLTLVQIASNWAEQDPQADLAWLQSIPNTNRVMMMADAVNDWANSDPAAATAYTQALPHDDLAYDKLITALANNQASVDVNTALAWAQNLPEDGGRDTATTAVIAKLSSEDPVTAAAAIVNMPAGDAQTSAVQTIAQNWANLDPTAAVQWVLSLPPGAIHDTAATHVNSVIQQNDPATAFTVALTIGDATTQSNQLTRVLGYWLKTDPAAATTAVQSANIPDATRTRLLNTLQKGDPAAPATIAVPIIPEAPATGN
jgi:RNA polymerase sigma factor (sigma-70 family)